MVCDGVFPVKNADNALSGAKEKGGEPKPSPFR